MQHIDRLALMDKVDGTGAIELRMPGIQPGADFIRAVILVEPANNVIEVGQNELAFWMWSARP